MVTAASTNPSSSKELPAESRILVLSGTSADRKERRSYVLMAKYRAKQAWVKREGQGLK